MVFSQEAVDRIPLKCPKSQTALVLDEDALVNVDPVTRLSYPVKDDIPVMLIEEASELSPEEWAAVMTRHGRDAQTGEVIDNA